MRTREQSQPRQEHLQACEQGHLNKLHTTCSNSDARWLCKVHRVWVTCCALAEPKQGRQKQCCAPAQCAVRTPAHRGCAGAHFANHCQLSLKTLGEELNWAAVLCPARSLWPIAVTAHVPYCKMAPGEKPAGQLSRLLTVFVSAIAFTRAPSAAGASATMALPSKARPCQGYKWAFSSWRNLPLVCKQRSGWLL